jgi:hypothetical protein
VLADTAFEVSGEEEFIIIELYVPLSFALSIIYLST